MKKSLCEFLVQFYPRTSEFEDLRSTYIVTCLLNSFCTYTAISLNIATIHAMRKTSSLPKTLKALLLSLAISDVGVGLLVQPLYISLLVMWLQESVLSCTTYMAFEITGVFFSQASFLGVVAVSVDRFLAIHLHLRYQELVTHKRVVAVIILKWVFSLFISLLMLWTPHNLNAVIISICGVVCLLVTTMVNIRIYITVRRHKNQIQALQVQQVAQTEEMPIFASLVKSTVGIFYVYFVFWVCYLPLFISLAATEINGLSIASKKFFVTSVSFVFLNSSLNPVTDVKLLQIREVSSAN